MTQVHGVDLRLEMFLPATEGFTLDVDRLDAQVLGPDSGWTDILCDVVEFSIQRGDTLISQRPNASLEVGTLSATIIDRDGRFVPDDICELLGIPLTGIRAGQRVRLMGSFPADPFHGRLWPLFVGNLVAYNAEWLASAREVSIEVVDSVSDIAAINPLALDHAEGDGETDRTRFNRWRAMMPNLASAYRSSDQWSIAFRGETFDEPLMAQLQRWADTSLAHLGMRHQIWDSKNPKPYLVASEVGMTLTPYNVWYLKDCQLGYPGSQLWNIPAHLGHLTVQTTGVVNDCLASADRTQAFRYIGSFHLYGEAGDYRDGHLVAVTSDGGTTWGMTIGGRDRLGLAHDWANLPIGSTLELVILSEGQKEAQTGARSFRWNVEGPTSPQGTGWWLSGLIADVAFDYPQGVDFMVSFGRTSDVIPDGATAVRSEDKPSQARHGLQDYRRLDLRLWKDTEAQKWADKVVDVAAETTTYLDEVEVHVHRDAESARAIQVDLLDRIELTKVFPEFANRQVKFLGDVVGITDEVDQVGWVRKFHLYPLSAERVATGTAGKWDGAFWNVDNWG